MVFIWFYINVVVLVFLTDLKVSERDSTYDAKLLSSVLIFCADCINVVQFFLRR